MAVSLLLPQVFFMIGDLLFSNQCVDRRDKGLLLPGTGTCRCTGPPANETQVSNFKICYFCHERATQYYEQKPLLSKPNLVYWDRPNF